MSGRNKTQQKQAAAAAAAVANDKCRSSSNGNNIRATKAPQPLTTSSSCSETQYFISASFRSFLSNQSDACACIIFSLFNLNETFEIRKKSLFSRGRQYNERHTKESRRITGNIYIPIINPTTRREEVERVSCCDQAVSLFCFLSSLSSGFCSSTTHGGWWLVGGWVAKASFLSSFLLLSSFFVTAFLFYVSLFRPSPWRPS